MNEKSRRSNYLIKGSSSDFSLNNLKFPVAWRFFVLFAIRSVQLGHKYKCLRRLRKRFANGESASMLSILSQIGHFTFIL